MASTKPNAPRPAPSGGHQRMSDRIAIFEGLATRPRPPPSLRKVKSQMINIRGASDPLAPSISRESAAGRFLNEGSGPTTGRSTMALYRPAAGPGAVATPVHEATAPHEPLAPPEATAVAADNAPSHHNTAKPDHRPDDTDPANDHDGDWYLVRHEEVLGANDDEQHQQQLQQQELLQRPRYGGKVHLELGAWSFTREYALPSRGLRRQRSSIR